MDVTTNLFWLWIVLTNTWPDVTVNSGSRGLDSRRLQDIENYSLLVGMKLFSRNSFNHLPVTNLLDLLWLSILFVKYTDQCHWMIQNNVSLCINSTLCTSVSATNWVKVKWSEVKLLSRVWLFATPWTSAYQAPPMGFSTQEYWSGLPFPSPEDLPHPGIEPGSPAL